MHQILFFKCYTKKFFEKIYLGRQSGKHIFFPLKIIPIHYFFLFQIWYWYPVGCDHYLPILRDLCQGAERTRLNGSPSFLNIMSTNQHQILFLKPQLYTWHKLPTPPWTLAPFLFARRNFCISTRHLAEILCCAHYAAPRCQVYL